MLLLYIIIFLILFSYRPGGIITENLDKHWESWTNNTQTDQNNKTLLTKNDLRKNNLKKSKIWKIFEVCLPDDTQTCI